MERSKKRPEIDPRWALLVVLVVLTLLLMGG